MGLEPTTPCLQSRCSSQLSYVPERDASCYDPSPLKLNFVDSRVVGLIQLDKRQGGAFGQSACGPADEHDLNCIWDSVPYLTAIVPMKMYDLIPTPEFIDETPCFAEPGV